MINEIDQIIIALGYALDAGNPSRSESDRKECRAIAQALMEDLILQRRETKESSAKVLSEPGQEHTFTK